MKRVLIVSPRFPPTSAADLHRVRCSLPYFEQFGWKPTILSVDPAYVENQTDPLLMETIPGDLSVTRVPALPWRLTRRFGLGDLAIRSFPFVFAAGSRLLRELRHDLVYFSTTAFSLLPLGRIWKATRGVPFVLDLQDPWHSDYYRDRPDIPHPPKYWFSHRLHACLEPWTMKEADGLIATSAGYFETLDRRYPWLSDKPREVLPFGASPVDFDVLHTHPQRNRFFAREAAVLNGVYVGRAGVDMKPALRTLFRALKRGLERDPSLFGRVRLNFVGTDYAPGQSGAKTVAPVASEEGVGALVAEWPERVPYFEALGLLEAADFLVVPGSDDPQYTASKICPYILAKKPLLAVFDHRSSVCRVLRDTRAGTLVTLDGPGSVDDASLELSETWGRVLRRLPFEPDTVWDAFAPYTARDMTRRQCEVFDRVVPPC